MKPTFWFKAFGLALALVLSALPASADFVQLANGDILSGKVLGLDEKQLRLESDTLGQINIPRGKIASITLGNAKPATVPGLPAPARPAPAQVGAAPGNPSPEEVLKQFKATGLNPKDLGDIQKMLPLLATPEASKYFDDTVKGLLGGNLSINDIRKDALRARDELKNATKGLGPDVETAVRPYLMILEKFLGETQPPAKTEKPAPKK